MQIIHIDGIDVEIGNKVYTKRYWYLAKVIIFFLYPLLLLFKLTLNASDSYVAILLLSLLTLFALTLLVREIRRMMYKPTLLAIGFLGIYSPKYGLIEWDNILDVDFTVSGSNALVKSLIVKVENPTFTMNYWFWKPIKMVNNPVRIDLSYSNVNVREASKHAEIMQKWNSMHKY